MQLRADSDLGQVGSVCFPGIELQAQGYTEPLHHERVEYAWMIAVSAQDISGAIGIHQVSDSFLQTIDDRKRHG